jgi:hypothetical protein
MAAMTTDNRPTVTSMALAGAADDAAIAAAERRVYAAECWLRATRRSGIGEWVAGATALLNEAIDEFFRLGGTWSRPA